MNNKIIYINFFSLFTALYYAIIVYYGSTYLSNIIGSEYVWIIYSVGALLTLSLQLFTNKLLQKKDINQIVPSYSLLAFLNIFVLFILQIVNFTSIYKNLLIVLSFAIYIAFAQTTFMLASVMLEDLSKDNRTGKLRGLFITMTSAGYLIGPFIAKLVLPFGEKYLFLFSAIFSLITYIIFKKLIKKVPKITLHENTNLKRDLKEIWKNKNIRNILLLQTVIEMFYAGFVIYFPLKIVSLGIPMNIYLGLLIPIAILAFLIVPPWIGSLEDKIKNEKQILFISFALLSFIVSSISFIGSSMIIIWAILVFLTRVFSSSIETSTSSFLFKRINVKNTSVITSYNLTQPIAHFASPIIFGTVYFFTRNYDFVFITLAVILLCAIHLVLQLENLERETSKEV